MTDIRGHTQREVGQMVEGLLDRIIDDAQNEAVERIAQDLGVDPDTVDEAYEAYWRGKAK